MTDKISGLLKRIGHRQFEVRNSARSYRSDRTKVIVLPELTGQYALCEGAAVTGQMKRKGAKAQLVTIDTLGGMEPKAFGKRPRFSDMTAVDPYQRFELGLGGNKSMRIIDLISPIGKGTRQLIVSPPKAGKTVLLEQMVTAVNQSSPQSRIIVLLVDERPEEVTQFRRNAKNAEVLASTSDQTVEEHVALAELLLAHVQTELECGREVVLLIDSLTRLGRAFNNHSRRPGILRGATMSGGLESGVMEIPRKLFGLARTIENSGSVTIITTCLINTGSRMDQMIFEEFKGTGNSEIVLNRSLAEARIFPAIDIPASGTRKQAMLYSPRHNQSLATLRRVLSSYEPRKAIENLLKLLDTYPDNRAFLDSMCPKNKP